MAAEGHEPVVFREPGGTILSERVRAVLLDHTLSVDPMAELLLFSAARCQLSAERIRPLLKAGRVVICDRFYDSTVAYQGGGRGLGEFEWLTDFNRRVTGGLVPDRTYYIRVSPETSQRRRADREVDRLEAGGDAFFSRVQETYERIAREMPERFMVIDGERRPEAIADEIWDDAEALIQEPG